MREDKQKKNKIIECVSLLVCVREKERERMCVKESGCVYESGRVHVRERERERERKRERKAVVQ